MESLTSSAANVQTAEPPSLDGMPFDGEEPPALPPLAVAGDDSAAEAGLRLHREPRPALAWTTDRDLRILAVLGGDPASCGLEATPGTSLFDVYGTYDLEAPPILAHRLALGGEAVSFEQLRQGRTIQTRVEPLRGEAGEITGCIAFAVDVTGGKPSEETLHRERERAQVTLASIGDGVIRTDPAGRIDYLNPAAERLTGWRAGEAVGGTIPQVFQVIDELTRRPLGDPVARCLQERRVVESSGNAVLLSKEGRELPVRDSAAPIYGSDGALLGAVLVFKDVTQLRGMEREMVYLASHDELTGLLNRREFEIRLKRAIRTARFDRRHHALLYLDLDEFKVVNDTCGHRAGDEMLKQVTALLHLRVRRSDILARLGGDEFGVLLEDCPLEHARQIAEELRRTVREIRFCWREQIFEAGVSIGLVPISADAGDLGDLMSCADAACYVAKDNGRNRVHEYEPDDTLVTERHGEMQWIHRIHRAFEERRFRLFYQLIEPLDAEGAGQELLCEIFLRMLDRDGAVLEPGAFIAAAERYHLVASLDRWVLKTAFAALAEAQRSEGSRPVVFAINVSGQSIGDEGFLAFVVDELGKSRVDSRRLCFEITETAAIGNLDGAIRFISVLREKGCRFILDDFGSGFSSFAYLRDLQVDFLKIDGEFVRDMVEDRVKRAMVESINQIGHVMDLKTIAEWVEDLSTLEALKELGVDYAQGFWPCRPQPLVHDV